MKNNCTCHKEPWLAVVLSSFLAGVGQVYSGRIWRGSVLILATVALYCLCFLSWLSPTCDVLISMALPLPAVAIWIWSLFDAHKCARKTNPEDFENERKLSKDPWLALFLSDLIPGLGHLYLRKWIWGILIVITGGIIFTSYFNRPLLSIGLWAVLSMFVCFHAYIQTPIRRQSSYRTIFIITATILCFHLLNYNKYVFQEYIAEDFVIATRARLTYPLPTNISPGTSMKPTLVPGDRIFVRKNKKYVPKRGDVTAFKSPDDPGTPWIKRVAGFPGEIIEIKNEILYVDGQKVQHPALQNIAYPSMDYVGMEGEPYVVPENHIFVIGDNSANSIDSRDFGAIPLSDVIGKAYKIYWPLGRRGPIK